MKIGELLRLRAGIIEGSTACGDLMDVAKVLIQLVHRLSPDSYFEKVSGASSEWVLRPRNWIGLYFSRGRSGDEPKIIVSLDVWPANLEGDTKLPIRQGRKPSWAKFDLTDVVNLKDALQLIETAQRLSG